MHRTIEISKKEIDLSFNDAIYFLTLIINQGLNVNSKTGYIYFFIAL